MPKKCINTKCAYHRPGLSKGCCIQTDISDCEHSDKTTLYEDDLVEAA